ncbi:MAG: L-2-amino-thiazoline-4-carboxylic acid hydrolase [Bacillota bacterium]
MSGGEQRCEENVRTVAEETDLTRLARRMARLYHYIARTMKEELGRAETERILTKSVWRYGESCGREARAEAEKRGLPPVLDHFDLVSGAPAMGCERQDDGDPGATERTVTSCPLADEWAELGDLDLARLYCLAHQAKYRAYDPKLQCEYLSNRLDGADECHLVLRVLEDATEQPPTPVDR